MLIASAMHSAVLTGAPMSAKEQVQGVTKLLLNRTFIFVQGENIDLKLVHVIKNIDYVHTTEYVSCQSLIICRAARVWYFLCMNFCCKYVQMTPKNKPSFAYLSLDVSYERVFLHLYKYLNLYCF